MYLNKAWNTTVEQNGTLQLKYELDFFKQYLQHHKKSFETILNMIVEPDFPVYKLSADVGYHHQMKFEEERFVSFCMK